MRLYSYLAASALLFVWTPALAQDRSETITAGGTEFEVQVWDAAGEEPRGIILFGHGWGGAPANYDRIMRSWSERGYTVRAAINFDSSAHPEADTLDANSMAGLQKVVGGRFEVIAVEREAAAETGLPVVLAGHSFGAMVSQFHAEGKWAFGPLEGPKPAGVMVFSSPGAVPMLVTPTSYSSLDVPYMMVTGTADDVGAGARVWEEHRFGFDRSKKGDKTLVVVKEGKHNLIAFREEEGEEVLFEPISTLTGLFLDAYAGGDNMARTALAEVEDTELLTIERR